jgi:hypothetical protein
VIIVEAELSHHFEADQLIEQHLLASRSYPNHKIYQLLLNATLCWPGALPGEIRELCRDSTIFRDPDPRPSPERLLSQLLWFNWHDVVQVLTDCAKNSPLSERIVADTRTTMFKHHHGRLRPVSSPITAICAASHKADTIGALGQAIRQLSVFDCIPLIKIQAHESGLHQLVAQFQHRISFNSLPMLSSEFSARMTLLGKHWGRTPGGPG